MGIKVYEYSKCSTCVKALKFLDSRKVAYEKIPIAEHPPGAKELRTMLGHIRATGGDFKKLFNTSGKLYRELGISEKLRQGMTEKEALDLLAGEGMLVKRPFLLTENGGTVGFHEEIWKKLLK